MGLGTLRLLCGMLVSFSFVEWVRCEEELFADLDVVV